MLINCIVCNEEFEAMRKDKKCCSIRCSKKNNYLNNRDYYIKKLQENRQKNKEGYKFWDDLTAEEKIMVTKELVRKGYTMI